MTTFFKGYLLIIGTISLIMGLWGMFTPEFANYPTFQNIERGTPEASFIRTISGVFVSCGYVLIRFIFSSSKVQLGTVLIYISSFMLFGKLMGLLYEGYSRHDVIVTILGIVLVTGLIVVHKHRKDLLNYDL
tara:strand:- start:67 stop:462 length:396 start_codon:yes stop_codon:yes gene_type:complete